MGFFDTIKNKRYIDEIHPSLKDLVYVEKHVPENFDPHKHEPSTIYLDLPVTKPDASTLVSKPDYWPAYAQFGREQRYEYLQFLSDPYTWHYDTGYFFCLFYGLERQLCSGNFESASEVIFDLLKSCSNASLQSYAANALFFSALKRRAINVIRKMIATGIIYRLDVNAFIYAKILAKLPFTPEDLLHYRKAFGYGDKHLPEKEDVFLEKLREAMKITLGTDEAALDSLLDAAKEEDLPTLEYTPFANLSLSHKTIGIYKFTEVPSFRASCEVSLEVAKMNCSPQKDDDEKLTTKKKKENELTYRHGDVEFNEDEETFYQALISKLSHLYDESKIECWFLSDNTINFNGPHGQIGRVKLRGRKLKMQILTRDDVEWIEIADLDDAIGRIPEWVKYEEKTRDF